MNAITNSLPPVGDDTGVTYLPGVKLPVPVESSGDGDSFSIIHNPRRHVCPSCNTGYVRKPDHCHTCDSPLWFDSKREASKIVWDAS